MMHGTFPGLVRCPGGCGTLVEPATVCRECRTRGPRAEVPEPMPATVTSCEHCGTRSLGFIACCTVTRAELAGQRDRRNRASRRA